MDDPGGGDAGKMVEAVPERMTRRGPLGLVALVLAVMASPAVMGLFELAADIAPR